MSDLSQLRLAAREIFDATLIAVDAGNAVRKSIRAGKLALTICDARFDITNRDIYAIAAGKAAYPMATALQSQLGESFTTGVVSGIPPSDASWRMDARWKQFEGGHPLPNDASFLAARESIFLLKTANEKRGLVIFLISGGGSAMLELPVNKLITLEDLQAANQTLVNCGASIGEINSVRRAYSAIKGGKLAAHAPDCDQITLIVSDVPIGEERNVASGPTLSPPAGSQKAPAVLFKYDLRGRLPAEIVRAIEAEPASREANESPAPRHFVLLDNKTALEAAGWAARERGFTVEIAWDISDQAIEDGCEQLLKRLQGLRAKDHDRSRVVCLLSGGEFACPVKGDGIVGRNLETALRLATSTISSPEIVGLFAGSDGIDGNSPAAGAIIDNTIMERARSIGLDANDFLQRSDSYSFFAALGDAITTGATGTNVRDIRILLAAL